MSLRALGEDGHARDDVRAGLEVRQLLAVPAAALVARADADDATGRHEQVGAPQVSGRTSTPSSSACSASQRPICESEAT